jgi:hypothetical protein
VVGELKIQRAVAINPEPATRTNMT